MQKFKIGDLVTGHPAVGFPAHQLGKVFVITKVPRASTGNYIAKPPENHLGRGLKGPAIAFIPYEG